MLVSKDIKFYSTLTVSLFILTALMLTISSAPFIASQFGLSTGAATALVNFLSAYQTVATVASIVGVFTGVGTIGSATASTILYLLKKKGKAKAAAF